MTLATLLLGCTVKLKGPQAMLLKAWCSKATENVGMIAG